VLGNTALCREPDELSGECWKPFSLERGLAKALAIRCDLIRSRSRNLDLRIIKSSPGRPWSISILSATAHLGRMAPAVHMPHPL